MTINKTSSIQTLEYTNKILPHTEDSTAKKVAKWALILLSFGSVFLVTFLMDFTKKIITKLKFKQDIPTPRPLTHYEKIVKFTNRFWGGIKEGTTQMIKTSAHHSKRLSPYNRYGVTGGYILGSSAIFYPIAGFRGMATALTLNLLGIGLKPLEEHVWTPLQKKLHSV